MPHIESRLWEGLQATRKPESLRTEKSGALFGLFGEKVTRWTNEGITIGGSGQFLLEVTENVPTGILGELKIQVPTMHATISEHDLDEEEAPRRALYELEVSPHEIIKIAGRVLQPRTFRDGGVMTGVYRATPIADPNKALKAVDGILTQAVFL